jgi:hypothetical protein
MVSVNPVLGIYIEIVNTQRKEVLSKLHIVQVGRLLVYVVDHDQIVDNLDLVEDGTLG